MAVAAPLAQASSSRSQACTPTWVQSPYAGWVFVTDDQGVQYLEPIALAPQDGQTCTLPTAPQAAGSVVATTPVAGPKSPYPGWIVSTDDQGVPWLTQIAPVTHAQHETKRPASRARRHRSHSLR
jgi:hypothetical protein